jgi:hypothetical protein
MSLLHGILLMSLNNDVISRLHRVIEDSDCYLQIQHGLVILALGFSLLRAWLLFEVQLSSIEQLKSSLLLKNDSLSMTLSNINVQKMQSALNFRAITHDCEFTVTINLNIVLLYCNLQERFHVHKSLLSFTAVTSRGNNETRK